MPWCAWLETTLTGDLWPLGFAVVCRFLYYFVGIMWLTTDVASWGCELVETELPFPSDE